MLPFIHGINLSFPMLINESSDGSWGIFMNSRVRDDGLYFRRVLVISCSVRRLVKWVVFYG